MYYVYVIENGDDERLYKGFTRDIKKRLKQHNNGLTQSTKSVSHWKLVYCEVYLNKDDALQREKYLKSGWGRRYLRKVLKNYFRNRYRRI